MDLASLPSVLTDDDLAGALAASAFREAQADEEWDSAYDECLMAVGDAGLNAELRAFRVVLSTGETPHGADGAADALLAAAIAELAARAGLATSPDLLAAPLVRARQARAVLAGRGTEAESLAAAVLVQPGATVDEALAASA